MTKNQDLRTYLIIQRIKGRQEPKLSFHSTAHAKVFSLSSGSTGFSLRKLPDLSCFIGVVSSLQFIRFNIGFTVWSYSTLLSTKCHNSTSQSLNPWIKAMLIYKVNCESAMHRACIYTSMNRHKLYKVKTIDAEKKEP